MPLDDMVRRSAGRGGRPKTPAVQPGTVTPVPDPSDDTTGPNDPGSSSLSPEALTERLTDLVYTGVGLGVLAVNRAQVARRSAQKQRGSGTGGSRPSTPRVPSVSELTGLLTDPEASRLALSRIRDELQRVDDHVMGLEDRLDAVLDRTGHDLPEPTRTLVRALRTLADEQATQVRAVLGLRSRDDVPPLDDERIGAQG